MDKLKKKFSVVIPVYNEEGSLAGLFDELIGVMRGLKGDFEIIAIDDGSTDRSWEIIKGCCSRYPEIKGLKLGRNFGQTSALSAGISFAQGELIITMDGDGQNDPSDIPRLLEKLDEGYDLVNGWRKSRKDNYFTRIVPSRIANWLIGLFTGLRLKDFGCSLKVYRAEVIKGIHLYGEMHRMIPALGFWGGARVAEIEVKHRERKSGKSKYGLFRIFNVIFDLVTLKFFVGYFRRPLHFFGIAGVILSFLGALSYVALILMKLFQHIDMTGNPFLILGTLFLILGMQSIALGLLGEIGIRTYYETQSKPTYIIREKIGFE
jgi:glycosyltransferase involved in cell wall biosynthesis